MAVNSCVYAPFFVLSFALNPQVVSSSNGSNLWRTTLAIPMALLCLLLLFNSAEATAQAPGMLEFAGKTVKDGAALSGATVTVYRNGTTLQEQIKTGKNGKFRLFLVFGSDYKITFSYPGCVEMHLLVFTSRLPKERSDLFPLYQTEIPFFETSSTGIRIAKFKNPFTKIIYDGKKAFMDDEAYLAQFTKDLIIDPAEQAKLFAEKEAKEKAEKDAADAAEKAKQDALDKAKKDAEEKLLAEQKAKADELARAAELARLKAENQQHPANPDETMETAAIKLQREKEAKEQEGKKNKEIKTTYVNDLLKVVAENERRQKEEAFNRDKSEARTNTVIEQMRRESELKAKADLLRQEQVIRQKKNLENKQQADNEMKKLVEAAAFAERSVRINRQTALPDVKNYQRKPLPNVAVSVDDGTIRTIRTTVVTYGKTLITYRKETYFWGTVEWYKNDQQIDELTYNIEVAYFSYFINK